MNQHLVATFAAVVAAFIVQAQEFSALPEYRQAGEVSGTIRALGNHYMDPILVRWEEGFRKYQPRVQFENRSLSTAHAIAALYFNVADIGLMGREIAPLENLAFRRMFKYDPTELAVATGSYNVPFQTFAFAILVHKDNPLTQITFDQLAGIFGCRSGRNIRTWDQLGLRGIYAHKPIHVYGYATGSNLASFFELKVFKANASGGPTLPEGARWNCDLREYSNVYDARDKVQTDSGDLMMRDLGQDPYGIAYCGIASKTALVKTLAVSEKPDGPFVEMKRATIMDRSYPLTRSMYIYVNRAPGKPLDPKLKEFLTYILSRQGQESMTGQEVFYPLTAKAAQRELKKIE
ncbi:MAG: substrate-binding domain-containing protein [Acidobacteriaceae bacterium]|nr:substrate-binding domain-containing protein [Acidobacteriaceae bacterium]